MILGHVPTEQAVIVITLYFCMWEVFGSNLGQDAGYLV